jgi:hypothetical protein
MKHRNTLIFSLTALSLVASAQAQTSVHITGSSAFRGSAVTAIQNLLNSGYTYAYNGTSVTGSTYSIFKGTLISGGTSVIIKCTFSGSVGGLITANQPQLVGFLADGTATSVNAGTVNTGGSANTVTTGLVNENPEISFSDVYSASAPVRLSNLVECSNSPVGVIPFVWVSSFSAPGTITNVTPQIAQALFLNGTNKLCIFTGNSADTGTDVYALGRDFDSGTRLTAFAETGLGTVNPVIQYKPTFNGTAVSALNVWPASDYPNGLAGQTVIDGNGGFSSGGNLADAMRYSGFTGITYLGTNDATRATSIGGAGAGSAHTLTYNGVAYTNAAIQNGQYTFWGYEHLSYNKNLAPNGSVQQNFANSLASQIHTTDAATSGILISTMNVSRNSDGGIVGP